MEVLPTGGRDRFRLTALGCVGVLVTPMCRLLIRPKIPWVNVFAMLDPLAIVPTAADAITATTGTEALEFLAGLPAQRMTERVAAGLHRAYREQKEQGPTLHGRINLTSQLRESPGRKEQLHSQYEDWSVDGPGNRVVKAMAEADLSSPHPGSGVRVALRHALDGFAEVASVPLSPRLWQESEAQQLPADYRQLLDLCRLLADSLIPGDTAGPLAAPSFLLDMERLFERYVTRGIVEAFAQSRNHTVAGQMAHVVNRVVADQPELTMRPDVTIDRDGRTLLVVDAKWKHWTGAAETADLYQVLAYGTALGAEGVVLVYPGKRWRCQEHLFTHTPLRLLVCTLKVAGRRKRVCIGTSVGAGTEIVGLNQFFTRENTSVISARPSSNGCVSMFSV